MKKSEKLLTAVLATACMCLPVAATQTRAAMPDSGIVSPQYVAITQAQCELEKVSGQLSCFGKLSVQSGYKCGMTVELQQNNGSWTTVKTWSSTGNTMCAVDELWSPAKKYNYRLKITYRAFNSSGVCVESVTDYSNEVYYS